MSVRQRRPYGLWDSPITPESLAGDTRFGSVGWTSDGRAVWREERSGHGVLVIAEPDGAPRDLDRDIGVRGKVGYGGGDFCVHGDAVVFAGQSDGRLYRQSVDGGGPVPITPAFGNAASPAASPDGRWIAYVHQADGVDRLAVVESAGRSWPQVLAHGRDFYMQPRWSPDGRRLAWIAWDHPSMPWDGTELWLADVRSISPGVPPTLESARCLAGGLDEAVFQPEFSPDGRHVYYVSDSSGWGHLWRVAADGSAAAPVTGGEGEFSQPAWAQDMRTYVVGPDGRWAIAVRGRSGFRAPVRVDLGSGAIAPLMLTDGLAGEEYGDVEHLALREDGGSLAVVASGPARPTRVLALDLDGGATRVLARSSTEAVPAEDLARPQAVSWPTGHGEEAHGLLYLPAGGRFASDGAPPLVVLVHGGPTSQARARWDPSAQFFATRGYAALQLNYRGSTGYGREYMLRLRGNWGVCDVEDAVAAVRHLGDDGRVDAGRSAIMGGSAGGYTVLQTMTAAPEAFAAGVCMYGVSDLFHLARDTHKFELRYLDSLVGPLPSAADLYRDRSPVRHADRIRRPLAVFQGADDVVVPRVQSDRIVEALRRNGVPHVYHVYEGEGHGWRRTETIAHFWRAVDAFLREHLVFA